jgi:hypothetical protein
LLAALTGQPIGGSLGSVDGWSEPKCQGTPAGLRSVVAFGRRDVSAPVLPAPARTSPGGGLARRDETLSIARDAIRLTRRGLRPGRPDVIILNDAGRDEQDGPEETLAVLAGERRLPLQLRELLPHHA